MITLINPPGIKTFSGRQMHTPNPPLGLAYIAAAIKDAGLRYQVIHGTGEALDVVRPYPDRNDFMIQGLSFDEITARIHPDSDSAELIEPRKCGETHVFAGPGPPLQRPAIARTSAISRATNAERS